MEKNAPKRPPYCVIFASWNVAVKRNANNSLIIIIVCVIKIYCIELSTYDLFDDDYDT